MSEYFISRTDQAGIYYLPATRRSALAAAIGNTGLHPVKLAIQPDTNIRDVLVRIGSLLQFPDWYGANFDALFDCLTDPDCLPTEGVVLLLSGTAHLHQADPEGFTTLIEILQAAAAECRRHGTPLWTLVDRPGHGVAKLPAA